MQKDERRMVQRVDILGHPVDNLTMDEVIQKIDEFIASEKSHRITVTNANKLYLTDQHPELLDIIHKSDLVIPEQAIVIASRLLNRRLKERVSGIELMGRLLANASGKNHRIFFLGARPEVVSRLVEICHEKYEGINIVGHSDGYFSGDKEIAVLEKIKTLQPHILFVALGSPKQEFWIARHLKTIGVPVCIGVGGSFDVLSGYKKDAPQWTRCGLEWVYRLMQDRRLFKRYAVTNPLLMWKILKANFL
jgi:N-acetylglucosaminyldiphosphoundecaprenol N-acetyl-beta-D-mannosaminyltransferase